MTKRPLFQATAKPRLDVRKGNAGLWFDKFCDKWRDEGKVWTLGAYRGSNPKKEWIDQVTGEPVGVKEQLLGVKEQLREATLRYLRLAEARGGDVAVFRTQSRFVSGLGRSHPIENGFAWHPTLGTPYLPGSSVKGMVLAWAEETGFNEDDRNRVFGTPGRVGSVCFLDAIPVEPVRLEADVMTPHYAGWDEKNPPGDWRSPTPIPFLVTAEGTPFLFGIVPRGVADDAEDVARAMDLLAEALEVAGAGAKTAVGYGRMRRDADALRRLNTSGAEQDEERREQERLARLDPLERELEELATENKGQAAYVTWLQAVEKGRWTEDPMSRAKVLELIKEEMERAKRWKPTSHAKRPEKDHDHQRTLTVIKLMNPELH